MHLHLPSSPSRRRVPRDRVDDQAAGQDAWFNYRTNATSIEIPGELPEGMVDAAMEKTNTMKDAEKKEEDKKPDEDRVNNRDCNNDCEII